MSTIGQGKACEASKFYGMFTANQVQLSAGTVYYNGQSITTAAIGIDTMDFEDALVMISIGGVVGTLPTVNNDVYASATNDATAATLITGASFADVGAVTDTTAGSATTNYVGAIRVSDQKRYLFLRTEFEGTLLTIQFAAGVVLSSAVNEDAGQSYAFDV